MSFLEWVESASFTGYVQRNHHHSFWANREKGHQDNNYIFDLTCVEALVAFYRRSFPNREWKRLQNVADGCRGQYKSKELVTFISFVCCLKMSTVVDQSYIFVKMCVAATSVLLVNTVNVSKEFHGELVM